MMERPHLGYSQEITTRHVRTEHRIGFRLGQTALDLKSSLGDVPNNAKITQVDGDEDGLPLILFEVEKIAPAAPADPKGKP